MINEAIKNKLDCTGCHACESACPQSCITMREDEEGFLYPIVDYNRCVRCGKCLNVCPVFHALDKNADPIAYACINVDEETRNRSSSGGVFTLLAESAISRGGVVFGAAFNERFVVEHRSVETITELDAIQGSKYVQSKIGNAYNCAKEYLEQGRVVLFSGTPCQVAGLYRFLGKPYEDLITVDLICHGVPSPSVWRKYIEFREREARSQVDSVFFRDKSEGWRTFSLKLIFENKTEYRRNIKKDEYMKAFLKNASLRPSCYACRFKGVNRISDITLADFWGIEKILTNLDDNKGTSLIMLHSSKGKTLFAGVKDRILSEKVRVEDAFAMNSAAISSVKMCQYRDQFLSEIRSDNFHRLTSKYCSDPYKVRAKVLLKRILVRMGIFKYLRKG